MKKILYDRGMMVANAKVVCQTRSDWRAIVYGVGFFNCPRENGVTNYEDS